MDKVKSGLLDAWQTIEESIRRQACVKKNTLLFHYGDANSLKGIIDNKELWATNVRFLNDAKEIEICRELAKQKRLEIETLANSEFKGKACAKIIQSAIDRFFANIDSRALAEHTRRLYVTCFCEEGDNLSQWRSYGRNGEGYSVGFAADRLMRIPGVSFFRMIYSKEEFHKLFKNLVILSSKVVDKNYTNRRNGALLGLLVDALEEGFLQLTAYFKNEHFRDENEVRCLQYVDESENGRIQFRVSGSLVVPYVKIDLRTCPTLGIEEITAGPRRFSAVTVAGLDAYLRSKTLSAIRIKTSEIPFRMLA